MLISNKIWQLRQAVYEQDILNNICEEFNISPITAKVIVNRGLSTKDSIRKFLKPEIIDFYDPFLLKDMDKAVKRIIEATKKKEKIFIYGDYDVDGITSTAILFSYIKEVTSNVDFYIPDRIEEGYGLSINAIDKMKSLGANLIITVDCGITAVDEIEYIKKLGMDIIITDHHECKELIPQALAVINPKQKDCNYPFKDLAGVGVVFKLVQALAQKMNVKDVTDKYIEIVALGTVADVVPLLDENRIIVKHGLDKITRTEMLGLKSLIEISGLTGKPITTTSIGYILAPRINAAGRIGNARRGVELFLSQSKEAADAIAGELDQDNRNRQQTETVILNEALEAIKENPEFEKQKVIVLASEGWHHGVIGIVSSKITEKFNKPSILISLDGEFGKGSGRSISGFNIFEALMNCSEHLDKFGGHELAVGLSLKKDKIVEFTNAINKYASSVLSEEDFYPKVKIDSEINKDYIKKNIIDEFKMLEPFGISNPCPVFQYNGLKIVDYKTVGEDRHIRFRMEDEDLYIDSIGFNLGELAPKIDIFDKVDVLCSVETNTWNGQEKIQLNIKDIRTNQEIIFNEKYYSTLEYAMFSEVKADNTDKSILNKINVLQDNIFSLVQNGQKNMVLINTLKGAKQFIELLKKSKEEDRELFKICYNSNKGNGNSNNIAIINPHFENIEFNKYDNIIIYDLCFNKNQYFFLVNNSKKIYIMNNFKNCDSSVDVFDEIIPQRDELIKVYQYIKSRNHNQIVEEDIFSLTREIAISYNMNINSLKLRKILEIFQEMNLIKMSAQNELYKIEVIKQSGAKVNIQMSKGLAKLLQIKDEFDYMLNSLKQGQIC